MSYKTIDLSDAGQKCSQASLCLLSQQEGLCLAFASDEFAGAGEFLEPNRQKWYGAQGDRVANSRN